MNTLVLFCALFAAAAAEPGALFAAPYAGYSTFISPATTTITKSASSVLHPSPIAYSSPYVYPHFIKKRSPQYPLGLLTPSTYIASSPLINTYSAPFVATAPVLRSPLGYPLAHLIKKRSVALASPYVASYSAVSSPLLPSTYTVANPIISTPYYSSPIGLSTHFIKKRSPAHLTTSYLTPYAVGSSPVLTSTYTATNPLILAAYNSNPLGYATHFIKKRSEE